MLHKGCIHFSGVPFSRTHVWAQRAISLQLRSSLKLNDALNARIFSTNYCSSELAGSKGFLNPKAFPAEESMLRAERQRNRFWKAATISTDAGFEICLDGRGLKTPNGAPLRIPSDRATFAHLVAGEWETQEKILKTHALPLTSLAARAIDGLNSAETRIELVSSLTKYIDTDSVCYRLDYPQSLVKMQSQHFDPILSWVKEKFNIRPIVTSSIIGRRQPKEITQALQNAALQFDSLELAGFERATISAKSFIIGLALMNRQISVEAAAQASHVEIQFQISQWGEVEDTHDVEHQDIRRNLGAAVATTIRD